MHLYLRQGACSYESGIEGALDLRQRLYKLSGLAQDLRDRGGCNVSSESELIGQAPIVTQMIRSVRLGCLQPPG